MHHVPYDFFIRFPVCMANVVQGCCWQLPYACSRNTPWSSQHVRPVGCANWQVKKNFRFSSRFFSGWKDTKSLRFEGGVESACWNLLLLFFLVQGLLFFFWFIPFLRIHAVSARDLTPTKILQVAIKQWLRIQHPGKFSVSCPWEICSNPSSFRIQRRLPLKVNKNS